MRARTRQAIGVVVTMLASGALAGQASAAEIPNPTVEGPIEGGQHGRPFNHALEPLRGDGYDYTEREYFFGGTATNLANGRTAPYKSRMLVRLPRDPKAFTGRVYVEWLNVTATYDLESRWPSAGGEFHMRRGNGIVAVSAQLVGVCCGYGSLKVWDPQRYGPLVHPGDDFSFDIFAQSIEALRDPANNGAPGVDPMGGFPARKVVAVGTSQSAGRLTTFINDGYNRGRVDLFGLSRGGGPYEDFSTPIVQVNEENNQIRQPDNPRFVGWEEAGTAHAPQSWFDYSTALAKRDLAVPSPLAYVADACQPINRGTVAYSTRAITHWSDRYLETGEMPPGAPRMERTSSGGLVRDEDGLAKGGLRHPFIQVPVAWNSGEGCPLFGKHEAWTNEKIRSRYSSHCDYITKVRQWADVEVSRGWLLPEDRVDAINKAVAFADPWPGESLAGCLAAASGTGCLNDRGGARGRRLGPAVLGRTRARQRRALRGAELLRSRRGIDRYCAAGGGSFRIAYPTRRLNRALGRSLRRRIAGRAVLILTSSRRFSVRGIRPATRVGTLRRRVRGERRIRVGRNSWYLARARAANLVFTVRAGRVRAVGIASRRLTQRRPAARRFLSAWAL